MKTLGGMGGRKTLNSASGVPQIRAAFFGWESNITLTQIVQKVIAGLVQDTPIETLFRGIVQPLSPKQIILKPEGQRAWSWLQIHVQAGAPIKLGVNDRIIYNCRKYKIMAQNNYSANGYIEFHAVEDFQPGAP